MTCATDGGPSCDTEPAEPETVRGATFGVGTSPVRPAETAPLAGQSFQPLEVQTKQSKKRELPFTNRAPIAIPRPKPWNAP